MPIYFRTGPGLRTSDFGLRTSFVIALLLLSLRFASADTLVPAKDGSGVRGYKDTPKLPWCEWLVHDADRPAPPRVHPGPAPAATPVPADAIVLFGGANLSRWQSNAWLVVAGELVAGSGNLMTKENFGSCQLHVEWLAPTNFTGHLFDRGNNGVMLMGLFEIQIFDSYNEKLYADGQTAAIYGQTPPLVNVCRPPGEWQSFDIVFTAPVFAEGKLASPARVTVLHNGVLVQNNEVIHGETGHRIVPEYKTKATSGPLLLAAHNCPVRFRNVWIRPL